MKHTQGVRCFILKHNKKIKANTLFKNLEQSLTCDKYKISEHDKLPKNLNEEGILAGKLAKDIGGFMEGGGGGKPHLATAGGKNNSSIRLAVDSTQSLINELFNG